MRQFPFRHLALRALVGCVPLLAATGCLTARPEPVTARVVPTAEWPTVVDCVMLAARAAEYYAEADSAGVKVTPGITPLAQARGTGRNAVIGTIRLAAAPMADGLHVTAQAHHWDPPAAGRAGAEPPRAARTMLQQVNAQCLAAYPSAAAQ